jgi:trans-2,3-dihydro-3-hydroxyanthranilate isomerase
MNRLAYHLVDVFTDRPFGGNQLAVFTDGRGLDITTMQALAREMNLSESTFLLPPDNPANAYRVRIFTPGKELPMAGHPTVGTSFVLARERLISRQGSRANIVLEEGVGDIPVSIDFDGDRPGMIWMTQPLPRFERQAEGPEEVARIAQMLSLPVDAVGGLVEVVTTGVPFLFVPIRSLQDIKQIQLRLEMYDDVVTKYGTHEVFVFTPEVENEGSTVHSRMFAPELGIMEDPATGAATGPLGSYLVRHGLAPAPQNGTVRMVSEQGIELGRPSFLHIEIDVDGEDIRGVRVGGRCVYMGHGEIELA